MDLVIIQTRETTRNDDDKVDHNCNGVEENIGSCNDVSDKLDVLLVLRCESCLTTSRGSGARLTLALALWDG